MTELKRERDTLKREVEELKQKLASKPADGAAAPAATGAGFSREREFLNLRETINKKEREVLDLKDTLDGKERLGARRGDQAARHRAQAARSRRAQPDHGEGAGRGARRRSTRSGHDKERVVEREKQVKARLDDALKTITRYEGEIENWKEKHATDVAAAQHAITATRSRRTRRS